ncbi:baseplate hub tail length determinator [Yersinia phage vB_YenM_TG1]|uniref:Baseplate hub tail length determinator n=1 Tax=Yersinia phage vB_YenM_TG1 TaxID=1589265 RepID=A0A0B4ZXH1_9CAUD|nr:baseplate hub subunit and tail length [Yersinia phage vB_YenM_TG1]AJD82002.1 baseplate hub tail length determinator [Yersinia phage vB_YenM_TG1]
MKQPSQQNSFRRKVIEDSKPERDAASAANSQSMTLDSIDSKLSDVQAASELTSEAVETKTDQLIDTIGHLEGSVQDVQAASELAVDAIGESNSYLKSIDTVSQAINAKLAQLTSMLEAKFGDQLAPLNAPNPVSGSLPEPVPVILPEDFIGPMLPTVPDTDPNEEVLPEPVRRNPEPEPEEDKKQNSSEGDERNTLIEKLDILIRTTQSGFKTAVGYSDKISNMLFKFTLTAIAQAAKTAAMILGIILAIDVIKANFNFWAEKFSTNFTEFAERAKEWGPLIESVVGMVRNISDAWNSDDPFGIIKAIAFGLSDITKQLADLLGLAVAKLTAGILRALGFNDKADALEGSYLKGYQDRTGSVMSEGHQKLIAKADNQKIKDEHDTTAYDQFKGMDQRGYDQAYKNGSMSKDTYEALSKGEAKASDPLQGLSEEERLNVIIKRNEAQAAINRTKDYATKIDPNNEREVNSLNKALADIKSRLDDPEISKIPESKSDLMRQFDELNNKTSANKLKPAPITENQEVQTTKRVAELQKQNDTQSVNKGPTQNTVVQANTTNTSRTMYNMPPTTNIPAPGMRAALGTN